MKSFSRKLHSKTLATFKEKMTFINVDEISDEKDLVQYFTGMLNRIEASVMISKSAVKQESTESATDWYISRGHSSPPSPAPPPPPSRLLKWNERN